MVKALLAGISLIFVISAQAQNEFTIKGKISGLEDSTRIVLYRSDGQVMSQIAQDTVINECFTFKGETVAMTKGFQTPGWMYGWLPAKRQPLPVIINLSGHGMYRPISRNSRI